MPKQVAAFSFGSVRQSTGKRHLNVSDLVSAVNVRQTDSRVYTKRPGYTDANEGFPAFDGATFVGPPDAMLSDGGSQLSVRDSAGRHWAGLGTVVTDRGRLPRVRGSTITRGTSTSSAPRPVVLNPDSGPNVWTFSLNTDKFYLDVSAQDGGVKNARITVNATGIVQLAANWLGDGFVWAFSVAADNVIKAYKFTVSDPTIAPTITTYYTGVSTYDYTAIEVMRIGAVSKLAVVAYGFSALIVHSYLDTATGTAATSPAAVEHNGGASNGGGSAASLGVIGGDGAGSFYYSAIVSYPPGVQHSLIKVNVTTLAVTSTTQLAVESGVGFSYIGATAGYIDSATGNVVVIASIIGAGADRSKITRYTFNGSTVTTLVIARASWLASAPIVVTGEGVFFLAGFDDAVVGTFAGGIQRTFFLLDIDGNHLGVIKPGVCAASYHTSKGGSLLSDGRAPVPISINGGPTFAIGLAGTSGLSGVDVATQTFVVGANATVGYGKPVLLSNGLSVAPGSIPAAWGYRDNVFELGPLTAPHFLSTTGVSADVAVAAVYRIVQADGTIWRSAPVIGSIPGGGSVSIPTLRHVLSSKTVAKIEYYSGTPLTLQTVLDNDPTVDAITFVPPVGVVPDEILYTQGGALSAAPVPQFEAVGAWRNRLFGAHGNEIWVSQEIEPGFGPRFNEILRTPFVEGTGNVVGIAAIDWNYLAIFKTNAIVVISGPGPDGRGSGNYVAQQLSVRSGATNPGSIVGGCPAGCFFQDTATGRIKVIGPDLAVRDACESWDTHSGETVTAAVHDSAKETVQFFTSGPRVLVLDYRHPTETSPIGQGYTWSSAGLLQGYAATVSSVGPLHMLSSGKILTPGVNFIDDNLALVFASLRTGSLQPAGILGEWQLSEIGFLGTLFGKSRLQITTWPDDATTGDVAGVTFFDGQQAKPSTRPPNCGRIHSVEILIEEVAVDGGFEGKFDFEGLALTFSSIGRTKHANSPGVF